MKLIIQIFVVAISSASGVAQAACYHQDLTRKQYQNIPGKTVDMTIQWNGLINSPGAIAIGDEFPLVADFSCNYDSDSQTSNSLDRRRCTINEGGGTFFTTMGKDKDGSSIIKSIIVNGKFAGVRASDSRDPKDLDLGIRGQGNLQIELTPIDDPKDTTCKDFFDAPILETGKSSFSTPGSSTTAPEHSG